MEVTGKLVNQLPQKIGKGVFWYEQATVELPPVDVSKIPFRNRELRDGLFMCKTDGIGIYQLGELVYVFPQSQPKQEQEVEVPKKLKLNDVYGYNPSPEINAVLVTRMHDSIGVIIDKLNEIIKYLEKKE